MNPYNHYFAISDLTFSKYPHPIFSNKLLTSYLGVLLIVSVCTLIGSVLFDYVNSSTLIMLYLLGIVGVTLLDSEHKGPSVFAALLSTLAFDYFFIQPYFSFAVSDTQYLFTLFVMLIVSQMLCHLNLLIKKQSESTRKATMQVESEKLQNLLLTSISHDLRTPLTAIMGSASILLKPEKLSNDVSFELAKNIFDESKRLNHQVTNILQMIRLESRIVKMNKELHFAEDVIEDSIHRLTDLIGARFIDIKIDNNLPSIPIDSVLIQQVMVNLVENAIKYSSANTSIDISARLNGEMMLFKVADRGHGLEEKDINSIFDKFYRSKKKLQNEDGFGLGLSICKNIIGMHGGSIWAENRIGGGAIFYFTLPLKDTICMEHPLSLQLKTA